ncbi:MAG: hypothetical protein FVQ80_01265 [Planctomycetes bacterium]|nr:hypothetical protein [Planctomycetota bacterium]
MNVIKLLPVLLSSLLIAAHTMRKGAPLWLAILCIALPAIVLFFPKRWAARLVQVYLIIAAAEWSRTLFILANKRIENHEPWMRFALIIGAVALLTAASACVFFSKSLKSRYKLGKNPKQGGEVSS